MTCLMNFIDTNLIEICVSYLKENLKKQIQVYLVPIFYIRVKFQFKYINFL